MPEMFEIVIFFLVIVILSFFTAWLYRRIVSGIPISKEERSVTRFGKYGYATEKKERKR
jgi:hypothetical protein